MKHSFLRNCFSFVALFCFAQLIQARLGPANEPVHGRLQDRRLLFLVDMAVILEYHGGPVLYGSNGSIPVYLIWYGKFNESDKNAVRDFFASFVVENGTVTDVSRWWNVTAGFTDVSGAAVARSVKLAGELNDAAYSRGKNIRNADVENLVLSSLSTFPTDPQAVYMVLTAADVVVESFCMNSCASHFSTNPLTTTGGLQLPYIWVGNPMDQCPGLCAWPFAQPSYGPPNVTLVLPPNGDGSADALIIQIAHMLAGTATNPFNNAYYQGHPAVPLEVGTACVSFGVGAYTGYPGNLKTDAITMAKFNAEGINHRKFLLPTLWDPSTRSCSAFPFVS